MIVDELLKEISQLKGVKGIAIGGSRASGYADRASDYDVYVYYDTFVQKEEREPILKKYCSIIECNNTFWETEDNCVMKDGIPIDIIYRNIKDFKAGLERVVFEHNASNGYTTCLWHNLINSNIFFDKENTLKNLQNEFNVSYPQELRKNIIQKNMALLSDYLPSYDDQIKKAVKRNDRISINHRTTEFFASYFDVLFALNGKTHPGEKRLVLICKQECKILPNHFEENINCLFDNMFINADEFIKALEKIILELKAVIDKNYKEELL